MSGSPDVACPVCGFDGPLALVRAHVTVEAGAGDGPHREWLSSNGVDLADDTTPSQPEIAHLLLRGDASSER